MSDLISKKALLEAIKTSGLDYDWSIASIRFEGLINSAPEVSGDVVDINIPEYHAQSMGCGLEDRDITDRYEAMQYGFDCAIDSVFEQIPIEPLYLAPPNTSELEQANKVLEGKLEKMREALKEVDANYDVKWVRKLLEECK